jgi:predicted PolB exonuclease-like 3'-5' exonuclease
MRFAVLDIETIPNQDLPEGCIPQFDETSVKLGNLKDPFKIREKMQEARSEWESGLDKKMSLDPDLCQVVCAVGFDSEKGFETFASEEASDFHIGLNVWAWIRERYNNQVPLVSFNGIGFDLPVLQRRAMYQDVSVAPGMYQALTKRQEYNTDHYDLMLLLAGRNPFSGKLETKSLNYYLNRFGLGSKMDDWDGSKVYPAWKEGRMEEILKYCQHDVEMTMRLFMQVSPWLIAPKIQTSFAAA